MKKLVKGDQVVVILGKDRVKKGEVISLDREGKYLIKGINLVKKHTKPTTKHRWMTILLEQKQCIGRAKRKTH